MFSNVTPSYENIICMGLIITYLKNFIFDDDCIACQKHGKHGDKKILIDSVLCLSINGLWIAFHWRRSTDVATTTFIFCSCQNWHVWVQCLFFNQPMIIEYIYTIYNILSIYIYIIYMHFSVQKFLLIDVVVGILIKLFLCENLCH